MKQKEFDFVKPVQEKTKKKVTPPNVGSSVKPAKPVKVEVTVKKEKKVITNYEASKDIILKLAARSALCFECPARGYCERSPDSSGTNECEESWKKWAFLPYEKA